MVVNRSTIYADTVAGALLVLSGSYFMPMLLRNLVLRSPLIAVWEPLSCATAHGASSGWLWPNWQQTTRSSYRRVTTLLVCTGPDSRPRKHDNG